MIDYKNQSKSKIKLRKEMEEKIENSRYFI